MIRLLAALWPYRIIRWLLASVFLYAALVKLPHLSLFVETVFDFGLIPPKGVFFVALAVIGLEIAGGAGLLFDIRGALGTVTCLLVLFMMVLSYGVAVDLQIDCGCFGPLERNEGLLKALCTDACLITACGYLYWSRWMRSKGPQSLRALWDRVTGRKRAEAGSE